MTDVRQATELLSRGTETANGLITSEHRVWVRPGRDRVGARVTQGWNDGHAIRGCSPTTPREPIRRRERPDGKKFSVSERLESFVPGWHESWTVTRMSVRFPEIGTGSRLAVI